MQPTDKYLDLLPIKCLIDCHFWIPAYQRGYRWEKQQVKDLLNDLWEFACDPEVQANDSEKFYCLQPVVVKKRDETNKWEVIDGQQRLTTIFIILSYLDKRPYELYFATRPRCKDFLDNLDNNTRENIDAYYITEAYDVVKEWFQDGKSRLEINQEKFIGTLLYKTKIIWYRVEQDQDDNPIEIFTRLNMGKIPLTNAELIKALFIKKIREEWHKYPDEALLKELELAREWDWIESKLQDPAFWAFIYNGSTDFDTRIDFLFERIAGEGNKKPQSLDDRYFTFRVFLESLEKEKKSVQEIWEQVDDHFITLVDWFNDRDLFHLIGFLVCFGEDIWKIRDESEGKTHSEFLERVKQKIREKFKGFTLSNMTYEENWQKIITTLLLFNVLTTLKMKDGARFPFDLYKMIKKPTLEHIHPQFPQDIIRRIQQDDWIEEHIKCIGEIPGGRAEEIKEKIIGLFEQHHIVSDQNIPMDVFQQIFEMIKQVLGQDFQSEDVHSIDNLALLDNATNSSFSNDFFYLKRKKLIMKENDSSSGWIPPCTRYVFLKYYSPNAASLYFWNSEDRKNYHQVLQDTLKEYISYSTEGGPHGRL